MLFVTHEHRRQRVQVAYSAVQGGSDREFELRNGYIVVHVALARYRNSPNLVAVLVVETHYDSSIGDSEAGQHTTMFSVLRTKRFLLSKDKSA